MGERCLVERTCLHCSNPVLGMREYCSDECKKERKQILRKLPSDPLCIVCSNSFKRVGNRQKCCSPECRAKKDKLYSHKYNSIYAKQVKETGRTSMRKQRLADPEKYRERNKEWWSKNTQLIKERRQTPEAKARANDYTKRRYRNDPSRNVTVRMRTAIGQALKGRKNGRKWETLVGYTCVDLVRHLERQFVSGMSWETMGEETR
jgi:hypothetical protein